MLSTLVAEIYGPPEAGYSDVIQVANRVRADMEHTEGVVDVDDFVEAEQDKLHFLIDQDKAALLGINSRQVANTLRLAIAGGRGRVAAYRRKNVNRWAYNCNCRVPRVPPNRIC